MKLRKAKITNFSAFGRAEFEFSDGLNVIIGSNGTGKTHLLKLLYSACSVSPKRTKILPSNSKFSERLAKALAPILQTGDTEIAKKLVGVFRPSREELTRLIHRGSQAASVAIDWESEDGHANAAHLEFKIQTGKALHSVKTIFQEHINALFIPSREVLAMFPGFLPLFDGLAFDQTYFDICMALMRNPLKASREDREKLVQVLELNMGGSVVFTGTEFLFKQTSEKEHDTEMPLLSEGMRKLAMLAHLIRNGAVGRQGIVFWDEPESSLNPKLIPVMAKVLSGLAAMGVQVFIATHDYLLTRELSLMAEHAPQGKGKKKIAAPIKFFCLSKNKTGGVVPEEGATLADLDQNPILEEFVAHYERERELFWGDAR